MARIYLIRHAQSVANAERKYQGRTYDTDLSELGKKQAEVLAQNLAHVKIDKLVASPLKRTMQTANEIARSKGMEVEADATLIESDHGDWEGKTFDQLAINHPEIWHKWHSNPSEVKFPHGESVRDILKRVVEWWERANDFKGDTAAVTHENIIQVLLVHLQNLDLDRMWNFRLRNASITEIVVHSPPAIVRIGDVSHLIEAGI